MQQIDWALACADRGWLVFPSRAKRPLVKWGTDATTDAEAICRWWNQWPDADVCIKTGAESDLVVVDWDAYKQEDSEYFPLWEDRACQTYTVRTAKGGWHFYFRHPGYPVANSVGVLAQHIDIRGDGGMVVAYHPEFNCPLAYAPSHWLTRREKVVDMSVSLVPANEYQPGQKWATHLLTAALADIRFAQEGKRNYTLYAKASDLYRLVWAGALDKADVTQALGDTALEIGLLPHEIAATLASAMRNGATQYEKGTE